ncbi:MAG: NAD(P)/FAD-dependent oxidoreductase [Haloferacaceae archaeon]
MSHVGIVGAGAAGAAAAYALDDHATVTLLEKSDAVSGRAATRTHGEGSNRVTYDYGANYVKSDDDRVSTLVTERLDEGLVEADEPIYVFDAESEVAPGRDADDHKWSYETGISTLARRLFDRTDARVRHGVRARRLVRRDGRWAVVGDDGEEWGPFDDLVLTPPAPQTARLCRTGEPDERRVALADAAGAVPYRSIYTGVLGYEFELDRPYYGLVNPGKDHEVGWISREECKPGHVPDGQTVLVVQASPEWSVAHEEADPDEATATLAGHAADVVGDDRLADPAWTDSKFWRYALPDDGVASGPVEDAAAAGLHVAGDWVAGAARVHAAARSGLEVGARIADRQG